MNRRRLLAGLTGLLGAAVAAPALASPLPTSEAGVLGLPVPELPQLYGLQHDGITAHNWQRQQMLAAGKPLPTIGESLSFDTAQVWDYTKSLRHVMAQVDQLQARLDAANAQVQALHRDAIGWEVRAKTVAKANDQRFEVSPRDPETTWLSDAEGHLWTFFHMPPLTERVPGAHP